MLEDLLSEVLGKKKKVRDLFTPGQIEKMKTDTAGHDFNCKCKQCMTIAAWDFSRIGTIK